MVNSLAKNSSFSSGVGPFCHYENSAVLLQVVEDLGEGEFSSGTLREGFVKDYVFCCDLARRHGGLFLPASRPREDVNGVVNISRASTHVTKRPRCCSGRVPINFHRDVLVLGGNTPGTLGTTGQMIHTRSSGRLHFMGIQPK